MVSARVVSGDDKQRKGPLGRKVKIEPMGMFNRYVYRGIDVEQLSAVIQEVERGDQTERWVDLVQFAIRTDPHLRGLIKTVADTIAGSEIKVSPGPVPSPDQERLAQAGADLAYRNLKEFGDWESFVVGMWLGELIGWRMAENGWQRTGGIWLNGPKLIPARQVKFANDYAPQVQTWPEGQERWLDSREEHKHRFIQHIPEKFDTPNLAGDFHAIAFTWLFKRMVEIWRHSGLERFGNPFMYVAVPRNAGDEARDAAEDGLENLSADHFGIFEEDAVPAILEMAELPGEAWREAKQSLNEDMTKELLGSTLNVEIGDSGGNRAAAESQFKTTTLPTLRAQANRFGSTVERDWFGPLMKFNAPSLGGLPPTPVLEFELVSEEPPEITDLMVETGVVKVDELRASGRLPPLGDDGGGNAFVQVPRNAPVPALNQPVQPEPEPEGEQRLPLARPSQMRLPWTSTRTSPTSSALVRQTRGVLYGTLGDPEL